MINAKLHEDPTASVPEMRIRMVSALTGISEGMPKVQIVCVEQVMFAFWLVIAFAVGVVVGAALMSCLVVSGMEARREETERQRTI